MNGAGLIASSVVTSIVVILSTYFVFDYHPGDLRNRIKNLGVPSVPGHGTDYNSPNPNPDYTNYKCPKTGAEMGCHSVQDGIKQVGFLVPAGKCPRCPPGSKQVGMDNISPGAPYRICECE